MGAASPLPPIDADTAWTRYQPLAAAAIENPKLLLDRRHMEATTRAYSRFAEAVRAEAQ